MQKIIEKIVEPDYIETGSIFKLKVKVIRYLTYSEIKQLTVSKLKEFTVNQLKGEE
nr:MAG TPA: hypothetical protein [Caudoviricetes sp.]